MSKSQFNSVLDSVLSFFLQNHMQIIGNFFNCSLKNIRHIKRHSNVKSNHTLSLIILFSYPSTYYTHGYYIYGNFKAPLLIELKKSCPINSLINSQNVDLDDNLLKKNLYT